MSKKALSYSIFFSVLVVGFYFVLTRIIPGFGKETMPIITYVRPFTFTDQDGAKFTQQNVAGKVYVAAYFFTTCTGICPRMNNNLKEVYDKFKDEKDFLILSHTCDPLTDSAAQLKSYAQKLGVNTAQWVFLTGRKDSLYNMARISYTIDDPANNLKNIDDDFLHTQFWALVDKNGNVRKIYDGLKKEEIKRLVSDIPKLLKKSLGED